MSYRSIACLIIVILLLASFSEAKTLSLIEAVQAAKKNNPEILSYKAMWEASKSKIPQAISLPDPKIGLEYDQIPSGSRNLEDGMKMLTFEQMIPFPTKIYAEWQMSNREGDISYAKYTAKKLEVLSDLKSAYYDLYFIGQSIILYDEIRTAFLKIKKDSEARYSTGNIAYANVLQANMEYLMAENELQNLSQERRVKAAKIKAMIFDQSDDPIETESDITLPVTLEAEVELQKLLLKNNPNIIEAKAELEAKDFAHLRSKMEFLPDTTLGLRNRVNDGWDAMLAISVPLYFWKHGYSVSEAGAMRESADADYKSMVNILYWELKDKYAQAGNLMRTLNLYDKTLVFQSSQALKSALASFQAGKLDFQDLIQIEKMFKETKLRSYESKINYGKALAELERIVGKEMN